MKTAIVARMHRLLSRAMLLRVVGVVVLAIVLGGIELLATALVILASLALTVFFLADTWRIIANGRARRRAIYAEIADIEHQTAKYERLMAWRAQQHQTVR